MSSRSKSDTTDDETLKEMQERLVWMPEKAVVGQRRHRLCETMERKMAEGVNTVHQEEIWLFLF